MGRPLVEDARKRAQRMRKRRGAQVETIGVDGGKVTIYSRLRQTSPGPGYTHFPDDSAFDFEYFEQLAAEKLVTRYKYGRKIQEWAQTRARNEALDCLVYALAAFFEEEFDQATAMESTQRRPMIPRTKIQAALAQFESRAIDPSRGKELSRTIQKTYSGYVHAAAAHIMDLYGGEPPHFHVNGMLGTEREDDHRYDSWNKFYRGILSFSLIYAAFGDMESFERIRAYADNFAKQSCRNVSM